MNVTLIGMPGSGKSSVGVELAGLLGFQFVDVDSIIEHNSGMGIQEIVDTLGDSGFLALEEATVNDLAFLDDCVFAPGGSAVYSSHAMKIFSDISTIIYLNVAYDTLMSWDIDFSIRGVIGLAGKDMRTVYDERLPLYERYAQKTIPVGERFDANAIAQSIAAMIIQSEQESSQK